MVDPVIESRQMHDIFMIQNVHIASGAHRTSYSFGERGSLKSGRSVSRPLSPI